MEIKFTWKTKTNQKKKPFKASYFTGHRNSMFHINCYFKTPEILLCQGLYQSGLDI